MTWLLVAGAIYVAWASAVFVMQRRFLFPRHLTNPVVRAPESAPEVVDGPGSGTPPSADTGGPRGAPERFWLPVDGYEVEAYYWPPEHARASVGEGRRDPERPSRTAAGVPSGGSNGGAPAILFAHGNAEVARDWTGAYRSFARRGIAVLLVEYPGYAESGGLPSEASVTATMTAAYDRLAARDEVDPERIVGVGRSLGGAAVCALSRHRRLAGLVLQSTFTSTRAFAWKMLVPPFLVRDAFDNRAAVRDFHGPVLIVHGEDDRLVPFRHGERLADAASDARLIRWSCGHNDCPPAWGPWVVEVTTFVESLAGTS